MPERADLGPQRADLGPEKGLRGDGRRDVRKYIQTDIWKFTRVLQDFGPLGRCPKSIRI